MKTIPVSLILLVSCGFALPLARAEQEGERPGREGWRGGERAGREGQRLGGEGWRGGEGERPQHREFGEVWKQADKDGDGMISRAEFDQMPRSQNLPDDKRAMVFGRLDKNQDGGIGREEIREILQHEKDGPPMPRIWELDADKDGGVTFEEFKQGQMVQKFEAEKQEKMFKHLDTNGDGRITAEDKPVHRPRPEGEGPGGGEHGPDRPGRPERPGGGDRPGPGAMIEHLDQDKDGSLSFEEFRNNPRAKEVGDEEARKRFDMLDRNRDGKIDRQDFKAPEDREGRDFHRSFKRPGGQGGEGGEAPHSGPQVD